jgi:hypothetical protein
MRDRNFRARGPFIRATPSKPLIINGLILIQGRASGTSKSRPFGCTLGSVGKVVPFSAAPISLQ